MKHYYLTALLMTLSPLAASAFSDPSLIQEMAQLTRQCAYQPYKLTQSGNKKYGNVRSFCASLEIVKNTARYDLPTGPYAVIAAESEHADQGDLNDVYLQIPTHQNQAFEIQKNILAYSDPVMAVLMIAGDSVEALPEVYDPSI
jgi:hypothetical protein